MESGKTNLIINYLPQTLQDEEFNTLFLSMGPIKSSKIVRDRSTGYSYGFGFVDYETPEDAQRAVDTLNGTELQNKTIKVAFARPSGENIKEANLYIKNIPKSMTRDELQALFTEYGKIIQVRILTDPYGNSRGVGFVLFDKKEEAEFALNSLDGIVPKGGTECLSVKHAEDNKGKARAPNQPAGGANVRGGYRHDRGGGMRGGMGQYGGRGGAYGGNMSGYWERPSMTSYGPAGPGGGYPRGGGGPMRSQSSRFRYNPMSSGYSQGQNESQNGGSGSGHILFVYNIGVDAQESTLWQLFSPFGTIEKVNVIRDHAKNQCKGYGFVTMSTYEEAANAIQNLNGYNFTGGKPLQVSFKSAKE
uniref:Elav2 n=1 Tax=Nephasoma pellucidum TaxID=360536 RepID=A0A5C1XB62_9ANNE|nr:Elav2 [Nephasoma pellucidum]